MLSIVNAAQILAVFPFMMKSHLIFFQQILKGLAAKGHQIAYVTPIAMSKPNRNIEEILIDDVAPGASTNREYLTLHSE